MANFTPAGKIKIGRVPFDDSYRHTLTFSSVDEQTAYFSSVCTESLENDSYTYIRMNNTIRVPFNAERLYTYDYVMYQNSNYGNKWFYAFITGVNYINENMTELVLELDVMQTWYFDYDLVEGFIEREHVNDDTIGAHLNAEPGLDLQYKYTNFITEHYDCSDGYVVMLVNALPHYSRVEDTTGSEAPHGEDVVGGMGSDAVSGGYYDNMVQGCLPVLYEIGNTYSMNSLKMDLRWLNEIGAADTIADMYVIPDVARPASIQHLVVKYGTDFEEFERPYVWTPVDNVAFDDEQTIYHPRPYSLDGYTPRNNKLLCYPYTYLELGDFSGRTEDLRWEYMRLYDSSIQLGVRMPGISDHLGYVIPVGYNGALGDYEIWSPHCAKPFVFSFDNKISWVYSAYQTWNAQNRLSNELAVLGGTAATALSLPFGIDSAVKAYSSSKDLQQFFRETGKPQVADQMREDTPRYMRNSFSRNMSHYPSYAGMGAIAAVAGNAYKMAHVPNSTRGNITGNSKMQNGYLGWYRATVTIRSEFARIMDDFFDCFGYAVERVKIPNREGRRSWNYVKMQNACHRGNVPADDMAKINSIYNSGITFWHTTDVGNYSLDNSIV